MNTPSVVRLAGFVAVSELAGIIGAFFTTPAIQGWYAFLNKPALNPPSWIFGPVWTVLYLFIGIATFLAWRGAGNQIQKRKVLAVFAVQWVLNLAWSIIFFRFHLLTAASVEIVVLWLVIAGMILYFARFSRWAVALLVPYLAWVGFATYLTFSIRALN